MAFLSIIKHIFPYMLQSFLIYSGRMQSPVRGLKFCGARARVACASYLLSHKLEQLKTFLLDCFWSLFYISEKKIYIT